MLRNEDLESSDPDLEEYKRLNKEVSNIKERLWLHEGDDLRAVISKRLEGYEDKLGVVHKAQNDLKALTNAMLNERNHKKYFPRGKPRIFLFIDDLDRCSPKKAVEVLEAIQLLLNTEVFVTIAAIDLRYMESCIEQNDEFKGVLQKNGSPSGLHYLEKILQLSYRVPSIMDKERMKKYLKGQFAEKKEKTEPAQSAPERSQASNDHLDADQPDGASNDLPQEDNNDNNDKTPNNETIDQNLQTKDGTLYESDDRFLEDVEYDEKEMSFVAEACTDARTSPRNTKRVSSSFKILKEIWKESGNIPKEEALKACIVLLAICASSDARVRVGMKIAFWRLEQDNNLPEASTFYVATFMSFWEKEKKFLIDNQVLPQPIRNLMQKYLSLPWNDWKDFFWETRAFTFVGDYSQFSFDQSKHLKIT